MKWKLIYIFVPVPIKNFIHFVLCYYSCVVVIKILIHFMLWNFLCFVRPWIYENIFIVVIALLSTHFYSRGQKYRAFHFEKKCFYIFCFSFCGFCFYSRNFTVADKNIEHFILKNICFVFFEIFPFCNFVDLKIFFTSHKSLIWVWKQLFYEWS